MNIPHVELTTGNLTGQTLFDALLVLFRLRSDRFSVRLIGSDGENPIAVTFEDLRGDQPQWPVRLEVNSGGKLIGRIDGELDRDVGAEFYSEALHDTVYGLLTLFAAEAQTSIELRRVTPDQSSNPTIQ